MADYSTIKGFNVETLAADPYASLAASGTWAAGNDVNTGKLGMIGFGATQNAVLKSVGEGGSPSGLTAKTETYNGTCWTEVADGSQACQGGAGFGTTAAGINATGSTSAVTQTWDGLSWADGNDVNTQVTSAAGIGTSTAGMKASGSAYPSPATVDSETWNGTSWTESPDVNQATYQLMGAGTTTAAIIGGGIQLPNGNYDTTETYDGTAWTAVAAMGTGRAGFGCGTSGTQSDWLVFGGGPDTPAYTANTEHYNGTAWTEVANLATAMANGASGGIATSALSVMGRGPGNIPFGVDTEEFTTASPVTIAQEGQVWYNSIDKVLKGFGQQGTGVWSSSGTMPANLYSGGFAGTVDAGVYAGGIPGDVTTTYLYDGAAWTTSPATLNTGRHYLVSTGIGTQTAALIFGGEIVGGNTAATEEFDGSAWAEQNDISSARNAVVGAGTQTAGLAITGNYTTTVQTYDGTSWASATASPQAKSYAAGGGTQTSAILAGGYAPTIVATADTYNGTSWTEISDINTARSDMGRGVDNDSSGIIFGGSASPRAQTEEWNGTSWTEVADLGTGRSSPGGDGTSKAAVAAGGNPPNTGLTEEWSVPNAIKTFTAS